MRSRVAHFRTPCSELALGEPQYAPLHARSPTDVTLRVATSSTSRPPSGPGGRVEERRPHSVVLAERKNLATTRDAAHGCDRRALGNQSVGANVDYVSMSAPSGEIEAHCGSEVLSGDALLVGAARCASIEALALDAAGVAWSATGIDVDDWLVQFTRYAGWQAVSAAHNALLPGRARG